MHRGPSPPAPALSCSCFIHRLHFWLRPKLPESGLLSPGPVSVSTSCGPLSFARLAPSHHKHRVKVGSQSFSQLLAHSNCSIKVPRQQLWHLFRQFASLPEVLPFEVFTTNSSFGGQEAKAGRGHGVQTVSFQRPWLLGSGELWRLWTGAGASQNVKGRPLPEEVTNTGLGVRDETICYSILLKPAVEESEVVLGYEQQLMKICNSGW